MTEFWFKFHWNLFPGVQMTISQHWFRQWLGAEHATNHCLSQCWSSSLTYICGTRGRWVNRTDNRSDYSWYALAVFFITWQTGTITYANTMMVTCNSWYQGMDSILRCLTRIGNPIVERESLSAFLGTEDIGVHIVHISCVIITYTLEWISSLT